MVNSEKGAGCAWQALWSSMTAENAVDAARLGIVAGVILFMVSMAAGPKLLVGETDSTVEHLLGVVGLFGWTIYILGIASFFGAL